MSNYNYPPSGPYGGHHAAPHYPPGPYPPDGGGYGPPLHHQGSGYGHPQYPPQQLPPSMYQHPSNSAYSTNSSYSAYPSQSPYSSQSSYSSQSPHNSGTYPHYSHTSARTYGPPGQHSSPSPLQAAPPAPPPPPPQYAPNYPPSHMPPHPPPPPHHHGYPSMSHDAPYAHPYAPYPAYPPSSAYPVGSMGWCEAVRQEARSAFFKADCDASGYLDVQEFYNVIRNLVGALVSYQEALQYFAKTDTDRNGRIGLNEFEKLYVDEIARRRY